jgi:hypothetical protein
MSSNKHEPGGFGLDTDQLRLVLTDVNAGYRALLENLSRQLDEAKSERDGLRAENAQLRKSLYDHDVSLAVDADPEIILCRKKTEDERLRELTDLKDKVCALEKKVQTLESEKITLTNEKNAAVTDKFKLEAENANLKADVAALKNAICNAPYFGKPEMPKLRSNSTATTPPPSA